MYLDLPVDDIRGKDIILKRLKGSVFYFITPTLSGTTMILMVSLYAKGVLCDLLFVLFVGLKKLSTYIIHYTKVSN